jgi:hypothetical protein
MATNFITNSHDKSTSMEKRLRKLITVSGELKFLVGFFYFSGWQTLYESLKERFAKNENFTIKLLVGLDIDKTLHGIFERY